MARSKRLLLALLVALITVSTRAAARKPNIIVILTDDLGWNTV